MDRRTLSRRQALFTITSSSALASLKPSVLASERVSPGPPVGRVGPVQEEIWGERIVDYYRWMENGKDPEWEPFMKRQAAYAEAVGASIRGRDELHERMSQL